MFSISLNLQWSTLTNYGKLCMQRTLTNWIWPLFLFVPLLSKAEWNIVRIMLIWRFKIDDGCSNKASKNPSYRWPNQLAWRGKKSRRAAKNAWEERGRQRENCEILLSTEIDGLCHFEGEWAHCIRNQQNERRKIASRKTDSECKENDKFGTMAAFFGLMRFGLTSILLPWRAERVMTSGALLPYARRRKCKRMKCMRAASVLFSAYCSRWYI